VARAWREQPPSDADDPPEPAAITPLEPKADGLRTASRYLMTAAAFVIVVAGMRAASGILMPILLAVFVAVISAPVFHVMKRRGVPSALAILVIMLLMVAAVILVIGVLERALAGFTGDLPRYFAAFDSQLQALWLWLFAHGIEPPVGGLRDYVNPQVLIGNLGAIASTLRDVLVTTFIVVIVAIFILLEGSALPEKLRSLPGLSSETWRRILQIVTDVRRYMVLKTVMSLLTGVLIALWAFALGIDFPILLGVLAFALNYIPNIGSTVAAIPGVLLAFIEFGPGTAAISAIGYVVINVGVSNGLEPRYLGRGLGLSPLVVLTSVIFWGWVLGPMGMLIAVPLTMTAKIALESDDDTRWLALLMSARAPGGGAAGASRPGRPCAPAAGTRRANLQQ